MNQRLSLKSQKSSNQRELLLRNKAKFQVDLVGLLRGSHKGLNNKKTKKRTKRKRKYNLSQLNQNPQLLENHRRSNQLKQRPRPRNQLQGASPKSNLQRVKKRWKKNKLLHLSRLRRKNNILRNPLLERVHLQNKRRLKLLLRRDQRQRLKRNSLNQLPLMKLLM